MKVKIKRLYFGWASIRDYLVEKTLRKGEGLTIECKGETMYIPCEELHKGKRGTELFYSKWDKKTYALIDFEWKTEQKQLELSTIAPIDSTLIKSDNKCNL